MSAAQGLSWRLESESVQIASRSSIGRDAPDFHVKEHPTRGMAGWTSAVRIDRSVVSTQYLWRMQDWPGSQPRRPSRWPMISAPDQRALPGDKDVPGNDPGRKEGTSSRHGEVPSP